jgi:signal peptidase I
MMGDDLDNFHSDAVPDPAAQEDPRQGGRRFALDLLETLLLSLLLFFAINAISARIRVDGSSMEPTLHSGEFMIVNRLAYRLGSPQTGDVVVFHFPGDPEQEYIKRVIGLPGDQVLIANGQVMVNGQLLNEPYIAAPPDYEDSKIVPPDTLYVLGDNRNNSSDSHRWGTVALDQVVGKAILVYWPPAEWGLVEHVMPLAQAQ